MSDENWKALNNAAFVARDIRNVLGLVVLMTRKCGLGLMNVKAEDGYYKEEYVLDS